MTHLRVPIAYCLKLGAYVLPNQVRKEHSLLICPQCENRVVLRVGKKMRHFAHLGLAPHGGESLVHLAAKHAIATFASRMRFEEVCSKCNKLLNEFMLDHLQQGRVEVAIGAYVVDVFFAETNVVIEICHTHPVEREKWNFLTQHAQAVLEVKAKEVLDAMQTESWVVRCKRLHTKLCYACSLDQNAVCSFCCRTFTKSSLKPLQTALCCVDCAQHVKICARCHVRESYKRDVCFECGPPCDVCGQGVFFKRLNNVRYCNDCSLFVTTCIVCFKNWVYKQDACSTCTHRVTNLLHLGSAFVVQFCLLRKLVKRMIRRRRIKQMRQSQSALCKRPRRVLDPQIFGFEQKKKV